MAFPTTSVLDDFNRANEDPLSTAGSWATPIFNAGRFNLISNAIQDASLEDGTGSANYYWETTFGPGTEVYITFATIWSNNSSDLWFWVNGTDEGTGTPDGYLCYASYSGGTWSYLIQRQDNGIGTEIRPPQAGPTLASGDKLGMEHSTSNVLTWYHKPSAGAWGAASGLTPTTDSTYTSGRIGLSKGYNDTTSSLDDFGGGTIVTASATYHNLLLLGVGA